MACGRRGGKDAASRHHDGERAADCRAVPDRGAIRAFVALASEPQASAHLRNEAIVLVVGTVGKPVRISDPEDQG